MSELTQRAIRHLFLRIQQHVLAVVPLVRVVHGHLADIAFHRAGMPCVLPVDDENPVASPPHPSHEPSVGIAVMELEKTRVSASLQRCGCRALWR